MTFNCNTYNRQHLPPSGYSNERLALLLETFTKAIIGVLISSGVIVIGMQAYVYYNFTQVYDGNSLPSSNYASSWAILYTAMAVASGSANVLIGFFLVCVMRAKRRLIMIFGAILTFIAGATSALAGLCAIAELIKLYDGGEIPQHVCVGAENYEPLKSSCIAWWWLELLVVILSGLAFIANMVCFVVLCVDIFHGNYYKELQPLKLDSVESSLSSVYTVPYSPYGDHSPSSDVALPRIKVVQEKRQPKPDDRLRWDDDVGLDPGGQRAREKRIPPRVLQRSLTNRPSLPIVIRKNMSSIYFY